jgi:hypothetical protein
MTGHEALKATERTCSVVTQRFRCCTVAIGAYKNLSSSEQIEFVDHVAWNQHRHYVYATTDAAEHLAAEDIRQRCEHSADVHNAPAVLQPRQSVA